MSDLRIAFVVIGRNEAERLAASIHSLAKQGIARDEMEIVYVDSSSWPPKAQPSTAYCAETPPDG